MSNFKDIKEEWLELDTEIVDEVNDFNYNMGLTICIEERIRVEVERRDLMSATLLRVLEELIKDENDNSWK